MGLNKILERKYRSSAITLYMSNVCMCRHEKDAHRWSAEADDPEPCTVCGCPTFRDEDEERKW